MTLVKCDNNPERYLNMDIIEYMYYDPKTNVYRVFLQGANDYGQIVSKEAWDIILDYGKAK